MSNTTTKTMLQAYFADATPMRFLSGFFKVTPRSFHSAEEVEIDIQRSDESVSIVIQDLSTGYRMNGADLYTNKGFKPPIHKEAVSLNSFDLIKRTPGSNPFKDVGFRAALVEKMFVGMRNVEQKIRRSIELQASQVLQTGVITLSDASNTALYTLNFQPKSTHFPTTGATWAAGAGDPIADLTALANVIRKDGVHNPDFLIFGEAALTNALKNTAFLAKFETRRADLGTIAPMKINGEGGQYRGTVELGNYKFDIWTYNGMYKNPVGGAVEPFVNTNKVIMASSRSRFDATFGAVPNIGALLNGGGARILPELPSRFSSVEAGMDLFTNVWLSNDGEQLFGGVGARPLMIPVSIDTFGCLLTIP